ncbi:MAG: serine/threonine protein kinase [Deltaproteobacteria bacterium]|nr:serine/threonine protein kinase [Deltaproteobacteria bacterium]MCW5801106.1 serine/threonine protein kinase [Deltaproteobacteria bacterium]
MSGIPAGAGSLLGKRLGKFEILALLALGGTAEIYLARIAGAAGFEKYVVVKCLHDHLADDAEFVKMFLDEARLAAHLDHSNIVQTMELGEYENRYYMVMEFLAGLSLAMVVRRAGERLPGGRIPVPLVLNIIAQSCAGLHYAHERMTNGKALNIVHRDISPQNLVVSFEGVVKVVDFGIAKAEMRETRTRSGTIKGKFAYMSPEQCVANNVDRRTDVFALGVIAHELLTGRRLFKKPSPYETYQAVIECAVEPPSRHNVEIDPALDPIVMRAVAKDKEGRYPTAEAFGDAILGYLHHRGKGSGPGDVARFFDGNFAQEIEEHGARMRELISGRGEVAIDASNQWSDEEDKRRNETVDIGPQDLAKGASHGDEKSLTINGDDLLEVERPSVDGLSDVIDDLAAPVDSDDDLPNERTRIEANPLELDDLLPPSAAPSPPPASTRPQTPLPALVPTVLATNNTPPPQVIRPAPGSQPTRMPPSGPLALPTPQPQQPQQSGKFPDLANLATMIAEEDNDPAPDHARTEIGAEHVNPGHGAGVDPHARTSMDMSPPLLGGNGRPTPPPRPATPSSRAPTVQPNGPNGQAPSAIAAMHAHAHPQAPVAPLGTPQAMPAQLAPNMPTQALGLNGPNGPVARPTPPGPPGPLPPGMQPMQPLPPPPPQVQNGPFGYPVVNKEMSQQMRQGATVYPSTADSARAADMASPVGNQYQGNVDWAAAAATPAKALPGWKLAALFIGAIGGALLLTLIIAAILR